MTESRGRDNPNLYELKIEKSKRRIHSAAEIIIWNEERELAKAYLETKKFRLIEETLQKRDVILNNRYYDKRIKAIFGEKFLRGQKTKKTKDNEVKFDWKEYIRKTYQPTEPSVRFPGFTERLRLSSDLSQNGRNVPMYCDLLMKSSDHSLTKDFTYIDSNQYDTKKFSVEKVNKFADKLIVKCSCSEPCNPKTCTCLKLQEKLFDTVKHLGQGVITDEIDYYQKKWPLCWTGNALICCGPLCRCNPKTCPTHVCNLSHKALGHRLEIFRRNENIGFGVRTRTIIEMDQLISEFNGCVMESDHVERDKRREFYSLLSVSGDTIDCIVKEIGKEFKITLDEWELFDKDERGQYIAKKEVFIEPYSLGNISRFVSHGCTPNIAPVTVIANYFHPIYHRLFFKAIFPIPAGSELFFNYGNSYGNDFKKVCGCGTLFCTNLANKKEIDTWLKLKPEEFVEGIKHLLIYNAEDIIDQQKNKFQKMNLQKRSSAYSHSSLIQLKRPREETVKIAKANTDHRQTPIGYVKNEEQNEAHFNAFVRHCLDQLGDCTRTPFNDVIAGITDFIKGSQNPKNLPTSWKAKLKDLVSQLVYK